MESILKASHTPSLNIQKPLISFFGLYEAITLTLMTEKFIRSTEENRIFKLTKSEYELYITYHSFNKAVDYFISIGVLKTFEDANGIQHGKNYILNPKKLESIFDISLECSNIYGFLEYIKDYIKDNFSIRDIQLKLKGVK